MRRCLSLLALALLVSVPAWGQSSTAPVESRTELWGVDPLPRLPGLKAAWGLRATLWLPRRVGEQLHYTAATGDAAALYPVALEAGRTTFIHLHGFFRAAEERPFEVNAATLLAGGKRFALAEGQLAELPPGRRALVDPNDPGYSLVEYTLAFPPLDPSWSRLELLLPWRDAKDEPVRIVFFRFREKMAQVDADLQAWIRFTQSPEVAARSAISPYLACAAYERFVAHGERFVVPFLLRELARQTPWRAGHLPRFLVFHVLSQTAWGKQNGVPSAGDERAARRVLRRWRKANAPSLPGLLPE